MNRAQDIIEKVTKGETFRTFGKLWDVWKANELIKKGHPDIKKHRVRIKEMVEANYGLNRESGWSGPIKISMISGVAIDHEFAQKIKSSELKVPGIIVMDPKEDYPIVIDGNHRAARLYMDGKDDMMFWIIPKQLTKGLSKRR